MDELLVTITGWLRVDAALALPGSFLWGMVSVLLSPCHMASIPLLFAYIGGQNMILPPRQAARYAVLFVAGLFLTILAIGLACAAAGRMLGDIGPYWQPLIGILLLWVAWTLFRPPRCYSNRSLLSRCVFSGAWGAFILGLAYGFLSGVCTFGFIAPILGIIAVQAQVAYGIAMLALFAAGHCLPLVVVGIFSARVMAILDRGFWQSGVLYMRRLAALIIAALGCYFLILTFRG
jgi:cytochrome c-type biogenesis protein